MITSMSILHIHTTPLFQVELEKTAGSRLACFGVRVARILDYPTVRLNLRLSAHCDHNARPHPRQTDGQTNRRTNIMVITRWFVLRMHRALKKQQQFVASFKTSDRLRQSFCRSPQVVRRCPHYCWSESAVCTSLISTGNDVTGTCHKSAIRRRCRLFVTTGNFSVTLPALFIFGSSLRCDLDYTRRRAGATVTVSAPTIRLSSSGV